MVPGMCLTNSTLRAFLLNAYNTEPTNGIFNFASSRSEWPIVGFTSIAVGSLNSIAQRAVVLKCMAPQRNLSLIELNHTLR